MERYILGETTTIRWAKLSQSKAYWIYFKNIPIGFTMTIEPHGNYKYMFNIYRKNSIFFNFYFHRGKKFLNHIRRGFKISFCSCWLRVLLVEINNLPTRTCLPNRRHHPMWHTYAQLNPSNIFRTRRYDHKLLQKLFSNTMIVQSLWSYNSCRMSWSVLRKVVEEISV